MPEGPLIAVVDDEKTIRDATQDLLNAAGFSTFTFENAKSFLGSPVRASVACLVTDMRMPGMSGLELYEHLAKSGAGLPTVIISSHPVANVRERARQAGITCVVIKPFTPDELLECVSEALARSQARPTIPKS